MRAEASARKPAGPETFLAPPPFDEVVPVEPGIHWLRVRLPFALDHVNLWLLEDADGWTIVDTGVANDATRAVWEGVLGGFLGGRRVARVLITHFHPDHFGLATWLAERTGAPVLMSRTEWLTGRMLCLDDTAEALAAIDEHYRKSGMSEELRAAQRRRGSTFRRGVPSTPAVHLVLEAGQELTLAGSRWRIIIGEGHAPEQVTLFSPERRLLIAADQILPRISPVVGVWASSPDADPLGEFLRSLDRYRDLPDDTRVLPSHDAPFRNLHARLDGLRDAPRGAAVAGAGGLPRAGDRGGGAGQALHPRPLRRAPDWLRAGRDAGAPEPPVAEGEVERWTDEDGVWRYARR